ncbi:F-box domain-containing protein [Favolaschia claudopus]|uniref:F-box domain-containing protein n=1 Tax=Favolaschia claudopus TaxID=2862362 RepID=A0AAW0ECD9_9AGAR
MTTYPSESASVFSMREILAEQVERIKASGKLDSNIAALRMQITTLVELRDRDSAVRAVLQHLIAPIRTLPVEILSEIFLHTLGEATQYGNSHIRAAYRVSHVCSEWRHVAATTAQLWTGPITLYFDRTWTEPEDATYAAGLREWLARSASVSIPFTLQLPWVNLQNSMNLRTLEEVVHVASRWRSLQFNGPGHRALSFLGQFKSDSLLCLEELELWTTTQDEEMVDPTNIQCFSAAPKLRKLSINASCRVPMPWAQLTALTLRSISTSDALANILNRCPTLVHADINLPKWELPAGGIDLIVLNHLRTLVLNFVEDGPLAMGFVAHLCVPVLDDLRLYFDIGLEQNWDEESFTTFQSRSPSITRLDLEIPDGTLHISSHAFRNVFLHTPLLSHLKIFVEHFCDVALLELLTYTDSDAQPLVPHLCSVKFTDTQFGIVGDALASMIRSRWWTDEELVSRPSPPAVARWSEVNLTGDCRSGRKEISQSFRDSINALCSSGLQIRVKEI